jgi:HlyD family secretion protein
MTTLAKPRRVAALATALAALSLTAGCGAKKATPSAQTQARSVSVVLVAPRAIQGGLTASGGLVPREDVAIIPEISGYRVTRVLTDAGAWVRAGQPLVQLDDVLIRSQLTQQQALAAQQKVLASEAAEQAERVKGLDNAGLLSKEQIDQRRFAAKAAVAQAEAQQAAANDVRTREALTVVRAPFAGLIIERTVRFGDLSGNTTPMFRLARDGRIELAADVSDDALDKIHPGDGAIVTLADGSKVQGTVRLISPAVDPSTKLGKVRIALPVRADIRAGGFATASFTGVTRSPIAVPETAVRYDAEGASVMAVSADNRVERVPVVTGERGGGYVELRSGPPDGARVVEKAGAMLVPGDYIRPAPAS